MALQHAQQTVYIQGTLYKGMKIPVANNLKTLIYTCVYMCFIYMMKFPDFLPAHVIPQITNAIYHIFDVFQLGWKTFGIPTMAGRGGGSDLKVVSLGYMPPRALISRQETNPIQWKY